MRKALISATALAIAATLLAGCTSGLSSSGGATSGSDDKTPVTITMWSFFTGREKSDVDARLAAFHKQYPWITVKQVGGQSDDTLLQAVRGGTAPDLALSQNSDAVSSYCATGTFENLQARIDSSGVAMNTILPSTKNYTKYAGKQCALPVLADVYGLYYNTSAFAKAGITEAPKTWDALSADAKKLTTFNPDGSIKTAGFIPFLDFFENNVSTVGAGWGLKWYESNGKAAMGSDPQWAAMFDWQKKLVDWYGYSKLQKFVAGLGAEFSAQNPFQTGKIAITVDGEWRVAFAADQAKDFSYATAPIPNVDAAKYGSGLISGTTVGIPQGSKHPDQAWLLAKYLATDTSNLVDLTLKLRNVPTTTASLKDSSIRTDKQFNVMLDIAANKYTTSVPGTPAGAAPRELLTKFAQSWEAGKVSNLHSGLAQVAKQIDSQIAQASAGNSQ